MPDSKRIVSGSWWRIIRPATKGTRLTMVRAATWFDARNRVARWLGVEPGSVEVMGVNA